MDWLSCIRKTVIYLEAHLCENVGAEDAAKNVFVSPFFLQKGFSVMTGCGIGEYLRNRRLYEAALELKNTDEKIIDIALKYCYETPESMELYEFPRGEWAVFNCIGPLPEALQTVNTHIFREWLPGNPEFEISGNANIEWYDCVNGEQSDPDYHSAIWIPVKRKK